MEKKIIKVFGTEIKSLDMEKLTVTALVSSKKSDRYGDVVEPEAFRDLLKIYKAHPVLLSSHSCGSLLKQIGEAESIKITEDGLEAKFKYYANMGNPEADWGWALAKLGIASYSIGFMSHEEEIMKDKEGNFIGRKFKKVELLEISQVLIPANREALQEGLSISSEESRLMEMAVKSMDKGELIPIPSIQGKDAVKPPQEAEIDHSKDGLTDKMHYTEEIIGKGEKSHTAPKDEDILRAIKEGVISAL